ncbi:delta(1)-pyrroline-2-carboxylate reductase family protein [Comamonas terrigena]|nr:delta(1)-pyrroline-2-carboxylate reductase family protein [Comamonas terrigena]MDH0047481.1 delta(1)-pyrroline-2-carboxylate reductase family protein [Comamonas terrigena]MDH0509901.1 delta(1)-pyrroline-2-carboxylate reductase family protein [Comamonas terrigena]MDH1089720.1 delta(1)-pyrroline-2-carboxylate reductase family protein [Comamonas terrigena]MDH1501589.1 delta(1)-pyrroline-2-carboxylate reductase family protein [Comamonas terrigena]
MQVMSVPPTAPSAVHAMQGLFTPQATEALLPWKALAAELEAVLQDGSVQVPPRIVMPLPQGGSLFCMPASDAQVAMTKLITFTPGNAATARPTIQGDVTIFDVATGQRQLIIDGPTVTARRTAAVSLLAALHHAPNPSGPLLIIGAGVQGKSHLEAFAAGAGTREVWVASRSLDSVRHLLDHAHALGLQAYAATDLAQAAAHCPNIVTCTSAQAVVLQHAPRADAFIAAVGAFTPQMVELAPSLCQHIARQGLVIVDTAEAVHEAGDLLQAGLDVQSFPTLAQSLARHRPRPAGPVLFKSCGWGGWDLAAARLAARMHRQPLHANDDPSLQEP